MARHSSSRTPFSPVVPERRHRGSARHLDSRSTTREPSEARRDEEQGSDGSRRPILGRSPQILEVISLASIASGSPLPVLLEGETGTGKELVARLVHQAGPRASRPFLAVNCAALPETLLEGEMFGYQRGAFTGADADRIGLFESAGEGTILLDEIGEIPPTVQAKLLRVLQESEVLRLGESQPRPVRARVIAATRCDLSARIQTGEFRADLYYRLAGFPIRVPPLRDRVGDIPILAEAFLERALREQGREPEPFDPAALAWLMAHPWPGNVRQLENQVRRAVLLARPGEGIRIEHLEHGGPTMAMRPIRPPGDGGDGNGDVRVAVAEGLSLRRARAEFESQYLARILAEHGGNISRAARALGISRVWLHKKISRYGIDAHDAVDDTGRPERRR